MSRIIRAALFGALLAASGCTLLFGPGASTSDDDGVGDDDAAVEPGCDTATDCPDPGIATCHCGRCAYPDGTCPSSGLRYPQPPDGSGACVVVPTSVSAGYRHTCARLSDGSVWCWGWNLEGQTGAPASQDPLVRPVRTLMSGAAHVSVGIAHSCAVLDDGGVRCWGQNVQGELGDGTETQSSQPVTVVDEAGTALAEVSHLVSRAYSTCALVGSPPYDLWCWGDNQHLQLGSDQNGLAPRAFELVSGVYSAALSVDATCYLIDAGGEVRCLGRDLRGELGDGEPCGAGTDDNPEPQTVLGPESLPLTPVGRLTAGTHFMCAALDDPSSSLRCWGTSDNNGLGTGTGGEQTLCQASEAVAVADRLLESTQKLTAGRNFACALREADSSLLCWGSDISTPSGADWIVPTLVPGSWRDVAAGWNYACAISTDRVLHCWGGNQEGQLGTGDLDYREMPTAIDFCPQP